MATALSNSLNVTDYTGSNFITGSNGIDSLLGGTKWGNAIGTGVTITYSFATSASAYASDYGIETANHAFSSLSSALQARTRAALAAWSAVANITFVEVSDSASSAGDIRIAKSTAVDANNAGAWAYFPTNNTSAGSYAGDVWLNHIYPDADYNAGNWGTMTLIHELGHALGLKHSFEEKTYNSTTLIPTEENTLFSVMSYTEYLGFSGYYAVTPMLYDIAAIQYLYGANTSYHTGANTYTFSNSRVDIQAIWDAGGIDTLDASNQTFAASIDLHAGAFSNINSDKFAINNVAIAFGVVIENAIGSNLADDIYGNAVANVLSGGGGDDVLIGDIGNDTLNGGTGNDILIGGENNDTLNGGTGNDTLIGGLGDDTYYVDSALDVITEASNEGNDTVVISAGLNTATLDVIGNFLSIEHLSYTGSTAFTATGSAASNTLTSGSGADVLSGEAGNDTLNGGLGNDTLIGGLGNDTYYVDSALDVITEAADSGTDTLNLSAGYTAATLGSSTVNTAFQYIEHLNYTGSAAFTATGSAVSNALSSGSGADKLFGLDGSDTLTGNAGNDSLDGGVGADTMLGGLGDDIYVVDNSNDVVTELLTQGTDTVQASLNYTLTDNVEKLTLTGSDNLTGTGNALANTITGNDGANALAGGEGNDTLIGGLGNDTLTGGTGNDALTGGAGDDVYYVDAASDVVSELATLGSGTDTVIDSRVNNLSTVVSITVGANIENYTLSGTNNASSTPTFKVTGNALLNSLTGGNGNDSLDGGLGNDTLTGNAGNDTLNGGAGIDSLVGGTGNDTYLVDNLGDWVIEASNEGIDTVLDSRTFAGTGITVMANVENYTVTGTGLWALTGNSLDNLLTGNTSANVLSGEAGNDTLNGGLGNDTLIGGLGNDTYYVDSALDVITEAADSGTDTLNLSAGYTAATLGSSTVNAAFQYIEHLSYTGSAAFTATGSAVSNALSSGSGADKLFGLDGSDTLTGNAGNDSLDGGVGADTMLGGLGDDIYVVDNSNDVVTELLTQGTDTVQASLNYTLTDNVEKLTLTGSDNLTGTGNALANTITGNDGANALAGGEGNDTLIGGLGNDTLTGGTGNDALTGGAGDDVYYVDAASDVVSELATLGSGTDTVIDSRVNNLSTVVSITVGANIENYTLSGTNNASSTPTFKVTGNALLNSLTGGNGNDSLDGGLGNDTLTGNAGNDTLNGGAGIDSLVGGTGNDTYLVDNLGDWVIEASNEGIDTVLDSRTFAGTGITVMANVENYTVTGTGLWALTGNSLDNLLTGNTSANVLSGEAGNDTLNGGLGNDTLIGGLGNDTYYVDSALDVITEAADSGTDTLNLSAGYTAATLGSSTVNAAFQYIEHLSYTGSAAFTATGSAVSNALSSGSGADKLFGLDGSDTLTGNAGNDSLDGGVGADTMLGGLGDDIYVVDNSNDVVTELLTQGTDTVQASLNYTLTDNVEKLTLTGSDNLTGTGNALANTITGNDGANALAGGEGNDTLIGGLGNDTLTGGTGNDALTGGAGDDVYHFARGGGVDRIVDTAGEDTLVFDGSDINPTQLWFTRTGSDLTVSIVGTTDKVTIASWFNGVSNHVDLFTAHGAVLADEQVQTLVNAMASLAPPAIGTFTLDAAKYDTVRGVINNPSVWVS